jgi:vitellogenic carboxypeptidase-like protein
MLRSLVTIALVGPVTSKSRHAPPTDLRAPHTVTEGPLILTGMAPEEARAKSTVKLEDWSKESHSGFFTTSSAPKREMFFWYFPAQCGSDCPDAPLLIWLQGGPGGSSLFGLFAEMGPFGLEYDATQTLRLKPRESSWNKKYGMLFIDNPVGAGFSFPATSDGYCTDSKKCVASNLYELMQQFYTVFPQQASVPLYVTGESYGGHYVPAFAAYIDTANRAARQRRAEGSAPSPIIIPLAGVAVGDGWIDPVNMVPGYPDMLYNTGLVDDAQYLVIKGYCDRTVAHIHAGEMTLAFDVWDQMLNGDIWPYANYFHNCTGLNDYDNYMNTDAPESFGYFYKFVNYPEVRQALHVGNATFNSGHDCEMALLGDFMVSLRTEMVQLMTATQPSYRVLVYSGQLDVIISTALTSRFLADLQWAGQQQYLSAPRSVWRVHPTDKEVAGYAKQVGNFSFVVVRAAGHIVPGDQPERAFDMIDRLVEGRAYENLPNPASNTTRHML